MERPNIEEIKNRADSAAPGPWWQKSWKQEETEGLELSELLCFFDDEGEPRFWNWENDGEFVAHSRTDIPELVEYIKYLEKELAHADAEMDWMIDNSRISGRLT